MGDMIRLSYQNFYFRRWDNFQEWIALDGVDASMANVSFLSILLSSEDQIEIR